jgi:hypothetical protein
MFDIEIVNAGNKGLRPGVVAIEYIDWLLAHPTLEDSISFGLTVCPAEIASVDKR